MSCFYLSHDFVEYGLPYALKFHSQTDTIEVLSPCHLNEWIVKVDPWEVGMHDCC